MRCIRSSRRSASALGPRSRRTSARPSTWKRLALLSASSLLFGCSIVHSATKAGMEPILSNGIDGFISEPDIALAESAIAGNAKLIEGVVATYPDERSFLEMAAMARAAYAFGFVHDELEAVRIAYPTDESKSRPLLARLLANYAAGRSFAERALALEHDWARIMAGRS